uniref:EGF-like domain-containing protein n=1 Tax=Magallana gigas TaxID=29159 RepID=A0A8W8IXU4_MAGGI
MNDIPGSYCGEGKSCFKQTCTTFEDARQTLKIIRPGGWGPWGMWQSCSRTCGVGVTYRRRRCNNLSPINHSGCEGGESNANKANICNPEPCSDNSSKQADLIKQRASETCFTMLENKVLNSSEYNSTGDKYSHSGEWKNNGTYNPKLRTCDCPTGFYGADCGSRCNIYCFNGAALDESTCTCQCKEHQTGRYCKCETGYTGKDCTEKESE